MSSLSVLSRSGQVYSGGGGINRTLDDNFPGWDRRPCSTCGQVHDDEGHPDAWPEWADEAWGIPIPTDGEGKGEAGEDLGPCDPADDDGMNELGECPRAYAAWMLRSGFDAAAILARTAGRFGPRMEDLDGTDRTAEVAAIAAKAKPAPTLAESVRAEARHYRSRGTDLGAFLADLFDDLASRVDLCDAKTPEQFRERDAALVADHERSIYGAGVEAGSSPFGFGVRGFA